MGAGGAGSVGGPETVAALKQMTGELSCTAGPLRRPAREGVHLQTLRKGFAVDRRGTWSQVAWLMGWRLGLPSVSKGRSTSSGSIVEQHSLEVNRAARLSTLCTQGVHSSCATARRHSTWCAAMRACCCWCPWHPWPRHAPSRFVSYNSWASAVLLLRYFLEQR